MLVTSLALHHFRNYSNATFIFDKNITVIVGQNGQGKSNLIEALFLFALGKSYRAENERQLVKFQQSICRIVGTLRDGEQESELIFLLAEQGGLFRKRYIVNGVAKRKADFASVMNAVLFIPEHLDLVAGQPSLRRQFLDEVLVQTDRAYQRSLHLYQKALRQRNALLRQVQETGARDEQAFAYWDDLLILHGKSIAKKRQEFITMINHKQKDFFDFSIVYDKSEISKERLLQYKAAEVGAGVTLVGPQRDDFFLTMQGQKESVSVRYFASRGQQRLVTLELKLAQIAYMTEATEAKPVLLLDDIFSELDARNIKRVLDLLKEYQVIITTTHKEFVPQDILEKTTMIELKDNGTL
jgi:DNA replication and repair protein RecF